MLFYILLPFYIGAVYIFDSLFNLDVFYMIEFYKSPIDEVLKNFRANEKSGLTSAEAKKRIGEYGLNVIKSKKKKSFLKMFIQQFKSFMIIILLIAAIISAIVGITEGEGLLDTFIILGILILNAFIKHIRNKRLKIRLMH